MTPNPVQSIAVWLRERAHLMVRLAPREAPYLLIAVIVVALLVLALYIVASKTDTGMIVL